jgi:hypothetical protein
MTDFVTRDSGTSTRLPDPLADPFLLETVRLWDALDTALRDGGLTEREAPKSTGCDDDARMVRRDRPVASRSASSNVYPIREDVT